MPNIAENGSSVEVFEITADGKLKVVSKLDEITAGAQLIILNDYLTRQGYNKDGNEIAGITYNLIKKLVELGHTDIAAVVARVEGRSTAFWNDADTGAKTAAVFGKINDEDADFAKLVKAMKEHDIFLYLINTPTLGSNAAFILSKVFNFKQAKVDSLDDVLRNITENNE